MKLKDYITERQIQISRAAIELNVSIGYLYELIAERMVPGRKTALQIVKWSGGMVKLKDLWPEDILQIDPNDLIIRN